MAENEDPPSAAEPPPPPSDTSDTPAGAKPRKKKRRRRKSAERLAREKQLRAWLESRLAVAGKSRADVDRELGLKLGTTSRLLRGTLRLTDERLKEYLRIIQIPEDRLDEAVVWVRVQKFLKFPFPGFERIRLQVPGVSPERPPEESLPTPVDDLGEALRMIEVLHQVVLDRIAAHDRPPEPPPKKKGKKEKKMSGPGKRTKNRAPAPPG